MQPFVRCLARFSRLDPVRVAQAVWYAEVASQVPGHPADYELAVGRLKQPSQPFSNGAPISHRATAFQRIGGRGIHVKLLRGKSATTPGWQHILDIHPTG